MIWIIAFIGLIGGSALLSTKRPGIAVGLLICMYGVESALQNQSVYFVTHGTYVNYGVSFVLMVAIAFSFFRSPSSFFKVEKTQLLSLLLYGFGFLSFLWTLAPYEYSRWESAIPFIFIYCIGAPILTRQAGVLQEGFKWALIIGVPLLLFIAFYCDWGQRGLLLATPIISNGRTVTECPPLAIATLASSIAIIALVWRYRVPFPILFRFGVLTLGLLVAFFTESRGQVVAIIGVSAIVYPIANRATNVKGLFITLIGFSIFGLIAYVLVNNLELNRWRGDRVESALIGRSSMWTSLFFKWLSEPGFTWFCGLGAAASFAVVGFYPHNLPVEILCELGLIGIGIYLLILILSANNSLKLLSRLENSPNMRGTIIVLIGLIGVNFALSLKEGSLYTWPMLFFYLICLEQQIKLTSFSIQQRNWVRGLFIIPDQNGTFSIEQRAFQNPNSVPR